MSQYKIYLDDVNRILKNEYINKQTNPNIKEALDLALKGGKRLRPIICLIIGQILLNNSQSEQDDLSDITKNDVLQEKNEKSLSKLVIINELVHSASLILDDLPCMDNDVERRGNPTIHAQYGETDAQLLSSLILSDVFNLLEEYYNETELKDKDHRYRYALRLLTDNLGINGASLGQYLDLESIGKQQSNIDKLHEKKTSTFFRISFLLSYIFCGGDLELIPKVEKLADVFGIAFQISDDFDDQKSDLEKNIKTNYVNEHGSKNALDTYTKNIIIFQHLLVELHLEHQVFQDFLNILNKRVQLE